MNKTRMLLAAGLTAAGIAITLGTLAGDAATIIGGGTAAAAIVAAAIAGELQDRRRYEPVRMRSLGANCPAKNPPADGGMDRLVALVTGEEDRPGEIRELLAHLEVCKTCAGNFRTIAVLRGIAPAAGDAEITPATLRLAEEADRKLM